MDQSPGNIELRGPYLRSIDHLYDEFARAELLVKAQVLRWRLSEVCAAPESSWGMVLISEAEVDRYLDSDLSTPGEISDLVLQQIKPWWDEAARIRVSIDRMCDVVSPPELRLVRVARLFRLSPAERDVLVLCLLAETDERYRRLFGYLQNDASRQSASVELLMNILRGAGVGTTMARDLFSAFSSLVVNRLVVLNGDLANDAALAQCSVRIDNRIASYLLDSDEPDARLAGILETDRIGPVDAFTARPETLKFLSCLPDALRLRLKRDDESVRLMLLGKDPRLATRITRAACRALRIPQLEFDVRIGLESQLPWSLLVDVAYREARLTGSSLFFLGCDALFSSDEERKKFDYLQSVAASYNGLTIAEADSSVVTAGTVSDAEFWQVDLPVPDYETRKQIWLTLMPDMSLSAPERNQLASELASVFQITESQIDAAIAGAMNLSKRECPAVNQIDAKELFEACRRQSGRKLITFSQRIEPRRGLSIDDLILPPANKRQLLDLQNRVRYHNEFFHQTGLDNKMRLGKGLLALFAGESGTGKTLAAEALASGQGVDLYKIDLSAITSKWIGETEKNLSRIFAEAETSSGCGWLFFDEGESLFGTRGEVRHAQDRMMNMEVNYLLQRIEEFSGVVILATNLRQNIDEAFLRRIHAFVEFPQPGAECRFAIWQKLIPAGDQRSFYDDALVDLSNRFELSGGNIRNIVLDAMFRARAEGQKVSLRNIAASLAREYQKLGRPITNSEFGDEFYEWIVADILDPAEKRPEQD
jgi:hypothetical protein